MDIRYAFREEDLDNGTAPYFSSAFESYITVSRCRVSRLECNTTDDYLFVRVDLSAIFCKEVDPGCGGSGSYSRTESGMGAFV